MGFASINTNLVVEQNTQLFPPTEPFLGEAFTDLEINDLVVGMKSSNWESGMEATNYPISSLSIRPTSVTYGLGGKYFALGLVSAPFAAIYDLSGENPTIIDEQLYLTTQAQCVKISPDNKFFVIGHNTSPYVSFFDMSSGVPVKLAHPANAPVEYFGIGVDFSPDSKICVFVFQHQPGRNCVLFFDMSSGVPVKMDGPIVPPTTHGRGVAYSPDGRYCVVVSTGTPFGYYDMTTEIPTKLSNPDVAPSGNPTGVAVNTDGSICVVTSESNPFVTFYDMTGDTPVKMPNPAVLPSSYCTGVAFSQDGHLCAVATNQSTGVIFYDMRNGFPEKLPDPFVPGMSNGFGVTFSADDRYVSMISHYTAPHIRTWRTSLKDTIIKTSLLNVSGYAGKKQSFAGFGYARSNANSGDITAMDILFK